MESSLTKLVSEIRFELFSSSKEVKYLTNLFRYFNVVYGELSYERDMEKNPSAALKNKSELSNTSNASLNGLFEEIFVSLRDQLSIKKNASDDFMLLYSIAWEAKSSLGELNNSNKKVFFEKIINQYNYEFGSSFKSVGDFMLDKKSRINFDPSFE